MQLHPMQTPSTQPLPRIATRYPKQTSPSQSCTIHFYRARETNNPDVCIQDGRGLWYIGPNKTVVESDTRKVKRPFASVKQKYKNPVLWSSSCTRKWLIAGAATNELRIVLIRWINEWMKSSTYSTTCLFTIWIYFVRNTQTWTFFLRLRHTRAERQI